MNPLLFGIPGATIILVAFALNVSRKVTATSKSYLWLNIIGSAILILYAISLNSIPFIVLNAVWVGFAAYEFLKQQKGKNAK